MAKSAGGKTRESAGGNDKAEIAAILRKRVAGEKLKHGEKRIFEKFERQRKERERWDIYESIPKKHWEIMSGRQVKVINEQGVRYGLPLNGPTINLPAAVRALHDFLAENANKLASASDKMGEAAAKEELLRSQTELNRHRLKVGQRKYIPIEEVHSAFGVIAGGLQHALVELRRTCGPAALAQVEEALRDAQGEIERRFSHPASEPAKVV